MKKRTKHVGSAAAQPRRRWMGAAVGAALLAAGPVMAQQKISDDVVKIGVLTDMSGAYSDFTGAGAVIAAQMAVEDFARNGQVAGKKIEVT